MVKKSEDLTMAERLKQAEREAAMWKSKYETTYKNWYVEKFENLSVQEKSGAARAYRLIKGKNPEAMVPIARNKFKVKYIEMREGVKESIYGGDLSGWSKIEELNGDLSKLDEILLPFDD